MIFHELLEKAPKLKIAIIGDLIEDKYIIGDVHRISPEAPVVVVSKISETTYAGGAGNVFMNLLNIGVDAYLFTTGNPRSNILCDRIFLHPGVTPVKTRVMSGNHHLLRIDEESTTTVPAVYDDVIWREDFETVFPQLDAVIFSDYHKGSIDQTTAHVILSKCNERGIPVIVDAKKDFIKYKHSSIIKCNQKEADAFLPSHLRVELLANYFVVTQGERGISWYDSTGFNGVDGVESHIIDVCGAGDTVTAIMGACYAAGFNILKSLTLANIAAAETCKHVGVYPITKEDLLRL